LFLVGCGASYYSQGRNRLENEDYEEAIGAFQYALKENPDDARVLRELGITHYRNGDINKATRYLLQAVKRDGRDGRTLFYLGLVFETTEQIRYAIAVYKLYINVSPHSDIRRQIEGRLTLLLRRQMAEQARAVLAQEASIDVESIPDSTIAILYFKNMGNKEGLDPLQKGIADMLITDLSKVNGLKVVERIRMQKLVEEMGLGMTGLVDEATAPRMGRLLGAAKLIQGSYIDLSDYRLRFDTGLINTKAQTVEMDHIEGKLLQLFKLQKDLVFRVVDNMGITLTQKERDEIEIIPTENILAFMAYCRGLDFEDRGMFDRASQEYQRAVDLDPNFTKAGGNLNRSKVLDQPGINVVQLESMYIDSPQSQERPISGDRPVIRSADPAVSSDRQIAVTDHMIRIGNVLSQSFLPGIESRKPVQEQSDAAFGNSANFNIRVALPEGR